MLVEIPDPEVILGVVLAFLGGVFALYLFTKIKSYERSRPSHNDPAVLERLEYYERQLIDMKIRMDAMDLEDLTVKLENSIPKDNVVEERLPKIIERKVKHEVAETESHQAPRTPNMGYQNATEYVLRLITDKPMTSRDVQITLGKSREHTSRLLKKLFDDGYVSRNTGSKPYSYSITEKGKEKCGLAHPIPTAK